MKIIVVIFLISLFSAQVKPQSTVRERLQDQARQYRMEGYRFQSRGDTIRALALYQKAAEIDPFYAEAYNDIGVIYEKKGWLDQAEKYYKKALEVNSDFLSAHTNLAFLYEEMGDIKKAADHWRKRYIQGKEGEYWYEVSRQNLLRLGAYPEIKRERIEKASAILSRELVYRREQQRLEALEEANFHFRLGKNAFQEEAYSRAIKHFNTVLSLDLKDKELQEKAREMVTQARIFDLKQVALINTQDALDYIRHNDYLSAVERLQRALSSALRVTQEDFSQGK